MRRFGATALFPLFALFCCALTGSAAAATGTAPTVTGGFPPLIRATLTATPAQSGDSINWETCDPNGTPVTLATGTMTYILQSTDAGHDVCAVEMDPTGLIVGVSDPVGPVGTGPTLSAAGAGVTEGQVITVTQGAWGAGSSTPTDTWYRCDSNAANCAAITGAPGVAVTGGSYTPARADVGSTIEVAETATSSTGASGSVTTAPTGVVDATPPAVDPNNPPTVSGTAQVGDTLTAVPGSWSNVPTGYTYQWERCSAGTCTPIKDATAGTYVPAAGDVGDTLLVDVAGAVDPGSPYGAVGSPYPSYPTSPVAPAPSPPPSPGGTVGSAPPPPAAPVVPVLNPRRPDVVGRLTATMQWTFRYGARSTQILALAVEEPALGARIVTRCVGHGCPTRARYVRVGPLKRCARARRCRPPRVVNLGREFRGRRLGVGARVTVRISRAHDIGKYYRFLVRSRRPPSVRISCLAPGSIRPGRGCTGV